MAIFHQNTALIQRCSADRGSLGDHSIMGDRRWAGAYGVDLDYVAVDNCKVH